MYTRLKILFWAVFSVSLLLISAPLMAVHEDAGTTGFNTLKLIYSARANAMGQALTGIVQNPDGAQFNPATLLLVPSAEVSSTYMSYFIDSHGGSIQIALPKDKYTAYSFFANYLNFGEMDRTEITSNSELLETGEVFGAYNLIAGASIAKHINSAVELGGSIKVIYDTIDDATATALMIDAGILHHPENEKIKVGFSMRNLGTQLSYYSKSKFKEQLPLSFTFGFGYDINDNSLLGLDINSATGQKFVAKLGYEYIFDSTIALRAGFRSDAADWKPSGGWGLSGLSCGTGWNWKKYQIDYSISSFGDLGYVNQLTLKYKF